MLVIYGPTVTGKTALAISLAKKHNGELISADSRQVYSGLDIGTGKVPQNTNYKKHKNYWEVEGVKIHGFDIARPGQIFSVVDFLENTRKTAEQIKNRGKTPIVVGGTGFYVSSLFSKNDLITIPPNTKLRKSLENYSAFELFQKLKVLNIKKAASLNESDN